MGSFGSRLTLALIGLRRCRLLPVLLRYSLPLVATLLLEDGASALQLGEYNLGPVSGDPVVVENEDSRTRDRRRAIQIGVYAAIVGIALGFGGYSLALVI